MFGTPSNARNAPPGSQSPVATQLHWNFFHHWYNLRSRPLDMISDVAVPLALQFPNARNKFGNYYFGLSIRSSVVALAALTVVLWLRCCCQDQPTISKWCCACACACDRGSDHCLCQDGTTRAARELIFSVTYQITKSRSRYCSYWSSCTAVLNMGQSTRIYSEFAAPDKMTKEGVRRRVHECCSGNSRNGLRPKHR